MSPPRTWTTSLSGAGSSLGLRRCAGAEMLETPGGSTGRKHAPGADDDLLTSDV